jgi:ferrochelatase
VSILRKFYNHPGFIAANVEQIGAVLDMLPEERRARAQLVFTAHSIPLAMARASRYEAQLRETGQLIAERLRPAAWELVYQSRSGPPTQPWLEPDIGDHLRALKSRGGADVVIAPIGFISDHIEVLYDLDVEARQLAAELGLNLTRAATAGVHPAFVAMIRELIAERCSPGTEPRFLGTRGIPGDLCSDGCCLAGHARPDSTTKATDHADG